jgi:hypothetical protein
MQVWEQDSFGHIDFDAASLRQPGSATSSRTG